MLANATAMSLQALTIWSSPRVLVMYRFQVNELNAGFEVSARNHMFILIQVLEYERNCSERAHDLVH